MTNYRNYLETCTDFPKQGVVYWDFTPILANPDVFRAAVLDIAAHFKGVTKIAAVEAKGFTLGAALAYELQLPLVLIRKPELTPGKTLSEKFVKEYGVGEYHIKEGVVGSKDRVLIVYDIMAGAGATEAAIKLVERSGGNVVGCAYVIELDYLKGREGLVGYDLFSLVRIT